MTSAPMLLSFGIFFLLTMEVRQITSQRCKSGGQQRCKHCKITRLASLVFYCVLMGALGAQPHDIVLVWTSVQTFVGISLFGWRLFLSCLSSTSCCPLNVSLLIHLLYVIVTVMVHQIRKKRCKRHEIVPTVSIIERRKFTTCFVSVEAW